MILKVNLFKTLRGKYCLIHLEIVKRPKNVIITLNFYSKQDNVAPHPTHNIILFQLDFNVKFPLLCLLHFICILKSTIFLYFSAKEA